MNIFTSGPARVFPIGAVAGIRSNTNIQDTRYLSTLEQPQRDLWLRSKLRISRKVDLITTIGIAVLFEL
jgi:hypothetical protein